MEGIVFVDFFSCYRGYSWCVFFSRRGGVYTSGIRHKFSCKPMCAGLQLKWLGLEDLLTHHVEGLTIAHDEDLTVTDDLGEVGLNFGIADSSMQLRLCCN